MRYGVCLGIDKTNEIAIAARLGFDYIETGFSGLGRGTDEEFEAFKAALTQNGIRCEAANGFLPRDYRVTGKNIDREKLISYVEKGMKRGAETGLQTVVFGSSGARNLDEETDYITGFRQLTDFLREIACPAAARYGITIVTEPLRQQESNIINTVLDSAGLAAACGAENVGALADIYHMEVEKDSFQNIRRLCGCLKHAHISYPFERDGQKRVYPKSADEYDYAGFLDALRFAGCERCSIEAGYTDFESSAKDAIAVLRELDRIN